jgi:uncharacterized repeat protein (TIGR01451 family)
MKKTFARKAAGFLFIIFIFILYASSAFADASVISVTMNPPNPAFGDLVQVTVNYCAQTNSSEYIAIAISSAATKQNADLSGVGQVFVVSERGIDVATSQPATTPGGAIGWLANANPGGGASNCSDCNSTAGKLFTQVYNVHVPPAASFPGCSITNLHLYVGMRDNNMNSGDWAGRPACSCEPVPITWPIGTITQNFSISKRTEGEVQFQDDLVLFSIDYEYWNGPFKITDIVPGGGDLALVAYGPTVINGVPALGPLPNPGATTGNFTWTMQDRTGMPGTASGTVWMLYKELKNPPTAGTQYTNNATGTMSPGPGSKTASATNIVGQAAITITKDQSESNPNHGGIITYYLSYNVNGMQLVACQPFDDIPAGTYGMLNGTTGPAVPGWSYIPEGGTEGQWTISDQCNTGDEIITGAVGATMQYPGLLYNGIPVVDHLCSGIIETDAYINPEGYEGADALLFFRNDGVFGNNYSYAVVISVDQNIGGYTGGHIAFQICHPSPTCAWPAPTITGADPIITSNKWWRIKVWIDPANQYHFRAKAWPRGDPEPAGYQIDLVDPLSASDNMDCNRAATTWKAGVGEQGSDSGNLVQDSYNNFVVYNPRVSANTVVWDTVPDNSNGDVTYLGQQGPYPYAGNASVVKWNLASISDEGGTFTWWGTVNTCNPITNEAWIGGTAEVPQKSNQVIANPVCVQVAGITKTAVPASASLGTVITWKINYCNDGVGDISNYIITDPIPAGMNCSGCFTASGTCAWNASTVTFTIGTVPMGTCNVQVYWWGTVTAVPLNPLGHKDYFAIVPDTRTIVAREMLRNGRAQFEMEK